MIREQMSLLSEIVCNSWQGNLNKKNNNIIYGEVFVNINLELIIF